MKTKLSILLFEVADFNPFNLCNVKLLMDENDEVPSKYVSTKSIDDTLQEILRKYANLNINYSRPVITDCYHEVGSTECEVIYTVRVPHGVLSLNMGRLAPLDELDLEEMEIKYGKSIQSTPRSVI